LDDWGVSDSSTDGAGSIYNVGVMQLYDGGYFYTNFGTCNKGLLVLADTSDTTFSSSTYIQTYERIALRGSFNLQFADQVDKDFTFYYQTLWYYSSSASSHPDDFDDDGVPLTFDHEGDFDVTIRITSSDDGIDISFSDVDTCYVASGLYGFLDESKSLYSCIDQPSQSDVIDGMCGDRPLPPATVEIKVPGTSTASGMVFSVLSAFIIASLFILF